MAFQPWEVRQLCLDMRMNSRALTELTGVWVRHYKEAERLSDAGKEKLAEVQRWVNLLNRESGERWVPIDYSILC